MKNQHQKIFRTRKLNNNLYIFFFYFFEIKSFTAIYKIRVKIILQTQKERKKKYIKKIKSCLTAVNETQKTCCNIKFKLFK